MEKRRIETHNVIRSCGCITGDEGGDVPQNLIPEKWGDRQFQEVVEVRVQSEWRVGALRLLRMAALFKTLVVTGRREAPEGKLF